MHLEGESEKKLGISGDGLPLLHGNARQYCHHGRVHCIFSPFRDKGTVQVVAAQWSA